MGKTRRRPPASRRRPACDWLPGQDSNLRPCGYKGPRVSAKVGTIPIPVGARWPPVGGGHFPRCSLSRAPEYDLAV